MSEAKATSRDLREGPRRQQPLPGHPAVMMVQKVVISWCCQKSWLAKQLKRVSCLPPVHVPAWIPSVCCSYCPCPVLQFGPAALQVHPVSPRTSLRASNKKPLELQPPVLQGEAAATFTGYLLQHWGCHCGDKRRWHPATRVPGRYGAASAGPQQAAEGRGDSAGP